MMTTTTVNIFEKIYFSFKRFLLHRLEVWPSSENGGFASRSEFFKLRINEDKFRRRFNQQTWNTKQSYETTSRTAPVVWGKAYKFTIEKLLGGRAIARKLNFCKHWYAYCQHLMR